MSDETFLLHAIHLAELHSAGGVNGPFGAVVVKRDKVVGEGWNQVVEFNDPTAHAEVVAIRAACAQLGTFQLSDCVLYSSCEPCPMCLAAVYWARIPRVVYSAAHNEASRAGFDDTDIYQEIGQPWRQRKVKGVQLLPDEATKVFDAWMRNPHKIPY